MATRQPSSTQSRTGVSLAGRWSARLVAALACSLACCARSGLAQEPGGLQAAAAIEQALVETIAKAERSVVAISRVRRDQGNEISEPGKSDFVPNEFGSGVVVDNNGLILTNAHVLGADSEDPASEYYVHTIDHKTYRAKIKAADPRSDLAVLSIEATDLTPIKFGNAKTLKKGQIVVALGNPYSIARDGQVSASWGIVANLSRKLDPEPSAMPGESKPTLHHFGTLIQTDAKLNLGTSGGALVNLKGEMVGLTTSVAAIAGFEQAAGYAIPVDDTFLRVVETLKQGREAEYGFLGVAPLDLEASSVIQGASGALINSVVAGTPADRADIRRGDVVMAVDGEQVHDVDNLMLAVGRMPVGAVARLTVMRDGRIIELTPKLAKFPVRGRKIVTAAPQTWRGLTVDHITALIDQAARPNLPLDEAGVVITTVDTAGPAGRAGLEPMTVVTHVAGARVQTPEEFFAAVEGKAGAVELRLWRSPSDRPARKIEAQ